MYNYKINVHLLIRKCSHWPLLALFNVVLVRSVDAVEGIFIHQCDVAHLFFKYSVISNNSC